MRSMIWLCLSFVRLTRVTGVGLTENEGDMIAIGIGLLALSAMIGTKLVL